MLQCTSIENSVVRGLSTL